MSDRYILDERGEPVPCPDLMTWAAWFENGEKRRVGSDERDGVLVSTVFLGLDHDFTHRGPPVLWETMIFGGAHDQEQWRYTSLADALAGHHAACDLAFAAASPGAPPLPLTEEGQG